MKLSWKVTSAVVISSILTMLVVTTLVFFLSRNALETAARANRAETVSQTADKVNRFLYERYIDLATFAERPSVIYSLEAPTQASTSALVPKLDYANMKMEYWDKIMSVNTQGKIVDSSRKQDRGQQLIGVDQQVFDQAMAGVLITTDLIHNEDWPTPTLIFASPVRGSGTNRPIVGVVIAYFSWQNVVEVLEGVLSPMAIFDQQGQIIAANNAEQINTHIQEHHQQIFQKISQQTNDRNQANSLIIDSTMVTYISQLGYLDYKGNNWIFFSEISNQLAMDPAVQNAVRVGMAMILVFVVVAILTSYVFRQIITKPVEQLSQSVTKITQGQLSTRISLTSKDEIGRLADAFNKMLDKLEQTQQSVEHQVEDKTKEVMLQKSNLDNQQKALLNILEDVEEEKEVTKALATDLQKFQLAVANSSEHMIITDAEGLIVYANQAASKITGFSAEEMIGQKVGTAKLWGGQMSKAFYEKLWQTVKVKKQTFAGEINNHRKNGEKYIAEASISPILDAKGKVTYFVAIERDVTHAKEVDRMKTEFISLASHQLRTPLSAMKWFLEMLLNNDAGKLNKQQHEFVQNIDTSNERMIALVNSLLNISRIESGRIIIDPHPTDLCKLIQEVAAELKQKMVEKKTKFVLSCNNRLPLIKLDQKLIREVFKNLLTNAIKYSPPGSEVIVLVSSKGQEVIAQVSDTGYGIPEAEQGKVFERFFRATNVVKFETDGTGLGLYLAKAIVESSKGKIWFKSQVGKGTTFWVSLPLSGSPGKKGEVSLDS